MTDSPGLVFMLIYFHFLFKCCQDSSLLSSYALILIAAGFFIATVELTS